MGLIFDLDRIRAEPLVAELHFRAEVPSTNDLALELAQRDETDFPLLVLAERQTRGRGRGRNRWWSAEGALTFSLVLPMDARAVAFDRRPLFSLTAGLAVCEALSSLVPGMDIGLKWPNDVYITGRKACGILVEVPAARKDRAIVGIGINVNNSLARAPEPLCRTAISLYDAARRRFDVNDVLIRVLRALGAEWEGLTADRSSPTERWQRYCMLTGQRIRVRQTHRMVEGICQGIDEDGALIVRTTDSVEHCFSGQVDPLG